MKKLVLLPLLALTLAFAQQAQAQYTVAIGPRVGMGGSWLSGKDAPNNQDLKVMPSVGGFLTYSSENIFGFTVEANYTQMGWRRSQDNIDAIQRLHYFSLPVLARFFFGADGAQIRPNLFIGPSFNFLVKGAAIVDDNNSDQKTTTNTDDFKTFDLGAHIGGGLNIRVNDNQWLDLNVRYMQGLTNINDSKSPALRDNKYMNSGVMVSVGYGWGI